MSLKTFKVLVPSYTDLEGKVYKRGDTLQSTQDLDKTWVNAFQPITETVMVVVEAPKVTESNAVVEEVDKRGEDVTAEFPEAEEYQLLVFKKNRKYDIYLIGETNPENEESLKKAQVAEFILENFSDDTEESTE